MDIITSNDVLLQETMLCIAHHGAYRKVNAIYDLFQSCWVSPFSLRPRPERGHVVVSVQSLQSDLVGEKAKLTSNLLGGVASDRSGDLVLLAEETILSALGVALGLSFLVLGVTLGTTFLAGGLPTLGMGHVADGLLDLSQGVLHDARSFAV